MLFRSIVVVRGVPGVAKNAVFSGVNAITVHALGGNDDVRVGSGIRDVAGNLIGVTVDAGNGNDRVEGGDGADHIDAGGGNDGVRGGGGDDTIRCGSGNDDANGDGGDDVVQGDSGRDTLRGGGDASRTTRNYAHALNILGGENIIIEDCDIADWGRKNPETGFSFDMESGIGGRNPNTRRVVIQRCKIHDNPGGGITLWQGSGYYVIEDNEIWNNAGANNNTDSDLDGLIDVLVTSDFGTSRVFQFTQVSINNVARVEVTKVPTPSNPADSMAGSIDMVSKSAFERRSAELRYTLGLSGNPRHLSLRRTPHINDRREFKVLPSVAFDYTLPVNRDLGLVVTGQSQNRFIDMQWVPRTFNATAAGTGASFARPYLQSLQLLSVPRRNERNAGGASRKTRAPCAAASCASNASRVARATWWGSRTRCSSCTGSSWAPRERSASCPRSWTTRTRSPATAASRSRTPVPAR